MSPSQPNIIVITTDQQRCDSLSCYGAACTSTPNIDRLAAGGALFERAYCANPVYTPARASIFSGQYPSRHGAWNVGTNVPQDTPLLSHRLGAPGYRELYDLESDPGAMHNRWDDPEYHWDRNQLTARIADHLERLESRVERRSYA